MKHRKSVLATYIKIIIVILIIAAAIYFAYQFFNKEYDQTAFETVKTDMLLIQGQTEVIAQKVEIEEEGAEYIGTKISEKQDDAKIQNLIQNGVIDIESKDHNYYCLDKEDLEQLGLSEIKVDDYYIVDYKQNDIISLNGVRLSEME